MVLERGTRPGSSRGSPARGKNRERRLLRPGRRRLRGHDPRIAGRAGGAARGDRAPPARPSPRRLLARAGDRGPPRIRSLPASSRSPRDQVAPAFHRDSPAPVRREAAGARLPPRARRLRAAGQGRGRSAPGPAREGALPRGRRGRRDRRRGRLGVGAGAARRGALPRFRGAAGARPGARGSRNAAGAGSRDAAPPRRRSRPHARDRRRADHTHRRRADHDALRHDRGASGTPPGESRRCHGDARPGRAPEHRAGASRNTAGRGRIGRRGRDRGDDRRHEPAALRAPDRIALRVGRAGGLSHSGPDEEGTPRGSRHGHRGSAPLGAGRRTAVRGVHDTGPARAARRAHGAPPLHLRGDDAPRDGAREDRDPPLGRGAARPRVRGPPAPRARERKAAGRSDGSRARPPGRGRPRGDVIRLVGASLAVRDAHGNPRTLLHPTDLSIAPGDRRLLLGANGSGKTSILRLLAGLTAPTAGRVLVDGVSIHDVGKGHATWGGSAPLWPRIAVLFEEPDPQFLAETVETEIAFGLESLALPAAETRDRVATALASHGLAALAARDPRSLSAGEKTRVLLAAMLAARPSVLLLDQCLAHLDPAARREEEARVASLAREGRLGVLRASQELEPASSGERIHLLRGGAIQDASELTPGSVLADPATPLPLSLRLSAALAAEGRWSGPLASSYAEFLAALDRMAPDGARAFPTPGRPQAEHGEQGVSLSENAKPVLLALSGVAWAPEHRAAPIVEEISFAVAPGEIVALVGASGAGKSSLLHLAAGLREPTRGTVERAEPVVKRTPGVMLALEYPERQLFARTVGEDVAASLWIAGTPAGERARRAERALREVGLDPERFSDRVPGTLSDGEKRRAALASFLIEPPLVLLWDEPTAGLDPEGRRALRASLARLRERGRAVLFASHDLDFVAGTADRVLVLGREAGGPGRLLGEGTPERVWRDESLLQRAGLPPPESVVLARALRERGWLPPGPVRDADSLVRALSRATAPLTG